MSRGSTEFCMASTMTCMTKPIPTPRVNMKSDVRQYGVSAPRVDNSPRPTAVMAVPTMGKRL
jgi:hypothetical protein